MLQELFAKIFGSKHCLGKKQASRSLLWRRASKTNALIRNTSAVAGWLAAVQALRLIVYTVSWVIVLSAITLSS
jgi:hypothetical protein